MKTTMIATILFGLASLHFYADGAANPAWQRAADNLHATMDTSADPCDDFYKYTCGNWANVNVPPLPPPYLTDYDSMLKLQIHVYEKVHDLFTNLDTKTQPRAVEQAKLYFDACMGAATVDDTYDMKYILKMFESYGKWPMLNQDWNGPIGGPDLNSASALLGRLAGSIGVQTFLAVDQTVNSNTPKRILLAILPGNPLAWYDTSVKYFASQIKEIVLDFARVANLEPDDNKLEAEATELAKIEISWAKAYGSPFGRPYNVVYTVAEAQNRWGYLDWTKMLTALAKDNIDPDQMLKLPLVVYFEDRFDKLDAIIESMSDRTMQNFLLWRLAFTQIQELDSLAKYRDAFYKLKHGTVEAAPKPIICASTIITRLPWAAGRVYVDQWRQEVNASKSIDVLDGMIDDVMDSFKRMLANLTWMDRDSRDAADLKVTKLIHNVAYNDFVMNNDKLNALYAELDLSENDDGFIRTNKVLRFNVWTQLHTLGEPIDRTNMMHSPATVNAFYMAPLNNINFPAAILNEPFFSAEGPMAVNFGAIGVVMGHELTHGFDNNGVKWDAYGAYHKDGWMTKHSMEGFNEMASCVTAQYDDYCFPQLGYENNCVSGSHTLGENIADNGGLMAAYLAYQSKATEAGLPSPMDKYTMDQIFFLSFGHSWCGKPTEAGLRQEIITGGHSPDQARVMVTLRNIPEFADAFKCNKGSTMAPYRRCSVWINGEQDYSTPPPTTSKYQTTPNEAVKIKALYWLLAILMLVTAVY